MVRLAIWNNDYTLVCKQPEGFRGMPPQGKFQKLGPPKVNLHESVFSSFSVEIMEFQFIAIINFYFFITSRLIAICIMSSYHACMIIFSFVATKHLDIMQ